MNTVSRAPRRILAKGNDGVALVIVLGFLVLITALVLAFFSSVMTEVESANIYASGVSTRQLADSVVHCVMAAIRRATTLYDTANWASQPGLIRVYNGNGSGSGPGNEKTYFKLYSARSMQVLPHQVDDFNMVEEDLKLDASDDLADWVKRPAIFADLNAPVLSGNNSVYPIFDPAAQGIVEGFLLGGPDNPADDANDAPMPVRWMYVLRDGTLTVPSGVDDPATGKVANWTEAVDYKTPNQNNPIVGRIAYWTDDETSKVNINTSSEGVFWDSPWARTETEQLYAERIPAENEFQRFPGHPAMTSLSPIFGSVFPVDEQPTEEQLDSYYNLIPRIGTRGTKGGSSPTVSITLDSDRLYASVDELMFTPDRTPNFSADLLEQTRFFVTVNSRAPEVNLFGRPRISLWPIQVEEDQRNTKDKLLAFCATVGIKPYYFQRFSAHDSGGDVTPPGRPASSQHPSLDWTNVPRNQELYAYLQDLTDIVLPGFGGKLADKYSEDRDQILTEMLDMIRSGVNSHSTGLIPYYHYVPHRAVQGIESPAKGEGSVVPLVPGNGTKGFGRFPTVTEAALLFYRSNETPSGLTPEQTAVSAILIMEPFNPSPGMPSISPHARFRVKGLDGFKIKASADPLYQPLGFPKSADMLVNCRLGLALPRKVGVEVGDRGHSTGFLGPQMFFRRYEGPDKDATRVLGDGPDEYSFCSTIPVMIPALAGPAAQTFDFSGGAISIEIWAVDEGGDALDKVQTTNMVFPEKKGLPLPTTEKGSSDGLYDDKATDYNFSERISESSGDKIVDYRRFLINKGDVIRSVEARPDGDARGDLRFFAALETVPSDYFHMDVTGVADRRQVHSLRAGNWSSQGQFGYDGETCKVDGKPVGIGVGARNAGEGNQIHPDTRSIAGYLIPRSELPTGEEDGPGGYRRDCDPAVPRGLTAALTEDGRPGDWDNGMGIIEDGPYINKPDEGNSASVDEFHDYFRRGNFNVEKGATFSPNRQVSSGVVFGSLPTGVKSRRPWETLLFCPNPAAKLDHFGFGTSLGATPSGRVPEPPFSVPPDHLFLDLFTMPIVEPYAISEPLSTAGKVNMNYQIAPFTYITRSTAVRAVLKSTKLMAIPTKAANGDQRFACYKEGDPYRYELRYDIDPDESSGTLRGFKDKFDSGDLFRSASQICDIFLVPKETSGKEYEPSIGEPSSYEDTLDWWDKNKLTGDNVREYPYGELYSRLTTRSNTYTVHFTVQSLKKVPGTAPDRWEEGRDQVVGEYRGSTTFERYIDPQDPRLVVENADYVNPDKESLESLYRYRILQTKKFAP